MENYSFNSYPDSGDSSPRSREIEFENPPPWDDQQQPPNYKAKFMCSYGGKIHPRPHDNQLSYIGGETKILAVDRYTKFEAMIAKLSALCGDGEVAFKYQLPGEDLDALISVTNDDDLEHMMHEYDRLYRASAKPARMRLFVFSAPAPNQSASNFGPEGVRSDRDQFVEALNSVPTEPPKAPVPNEVDYLFGLDKGVPPPHPAVKLRDSVPEPVAPPPSGFPSRTGHGDRVVGSEPAVNPVDIQRHLQELQRLQIGDHEPPMMYTRKSDENLVGAYGGDYYVPKAPEKAPQATGPPQAGFWREKQFSGGGFQVGAPTAQDQPVYVIPAPGTVYQTPTMVRPMTAPTTQGYYTMQRVAPDAYREQPVYNVVPQPQSQPPPMSAPAQPILPPQPPKMAAYTEGYNMVRPSGGVADSGGYPPVGATGGYDGAVGRQVYYAATTAPYHGGGVAVSSDMRSAVALGQDGKVVTKVSQASV